MVNKLSAPLIKAVQLAKVRVLAGWRKLKTLRLKK